MTITVAAPDEFASHFIANGTVTIEGYDVQPSWPGGPGGAIYTSAFSEPMYDVIVLPVTNFLIAVDQGLPYWGVPVFIDIFFPQIAVRVNRNAGITVPTDLEGKRVGVRGYAFNPGIWVRGALADMYGVDLTKVKWVAAHPNSLSTVPMTHDGFDVELTEGNLDDMLASGELDAVFYDRGGPPANEMTKHLFESPLEEALKYHLLSGVTPLNSLLVAKKSVIEENPGLGEALVAASNKARDLYFETVQDAEDHMGLPVSWLRQNGIFPHRNGLDNNRISLETIVRYSWDAGIIKSTYAIEDLFFPGTE